MKKRWSRTTRAFVTVVLAVPVMAACGDEDPLGPEEVEFAASLGVDLDAMTRLPSGTYVQTLVEGDGTAEVTMADSVVVNYDGWLHNGTKFDQGDGVVFWLDRVVEGFAEGLLGMVVGERRLIVIPPERGYGSQGRGTVPGNAILVFKVDLLEINPEP